MKKSAIFFALFLLILIRASWASSLNDGLSAYYQKQWDRAAENFKQAMQDDPKSSLALVYYVVSNFWLGTGERETRALEDILVDNPSNQLAQTRLGFMYYARAFTHGQKPDKALNELREAARLGQSPLVHTGLGIVYFDTGSFTRAQKELARAMDMNPNDVLAYEYTGRILLSIQDNPQSALNYFEQETRLAPNYPDGFYYHALALDSLGRNDEAVRDYEKTIELDPLNVGRGMDAKVGLGDLYLRNKDFQSARHEFEEILKLDPNNTLVKQRLAALKKEEQDLSGHRKTP